jgi:hypothetical protein
MSNVSAVSWQSNIPWNDNDVRFQLDQHTQLDLYMSNSLNQQQSLGIHDICRSTRTQYPAGFEPTNLCFYSLKLRSYRRSRSKYKFYSFWFDLTGVRTIDLPHSRANKFTRSFELCLFVTSEYKYNMKKDIN